MQAEVEENKLSSETVDIEFVPFVIFVIAHCYMNHDYSTTTYDTHVLKEHCFKTSVWIVTEGYFGVLLFKKQ